MPNTRMQLYMGPMFCGKTAELTKQLSRQAYAGITVLFRPVSDTRDENEALLSAHDGSSTYNPLTLPGTNYIKRVQSSEEIFTLTCELGARAIGIDEGQFLDTGLANVLVRLHEKGIKVFCAALDTDWQGKPFETTLILALCPEVNVHKLTAICNECGSETATRSFKKSEGTDHAARIEVGGKDKYGVACLSCWKKLNH